MWILYLWGAGIVYFKLSHWELFHGDLRDFAYYFFIFMVVKNIFFGVLHRVFSFMRTRDWLKHRKWENQKMKMEKHIYNQKYQDFLKKQELSNSNEIKEVEYEHDSK